MGTGITGLLIHELPYQFSGIRNIGNVSLDRPTCTCHVQSRVAELTLLSLSDSAALQVLFVFSTVLFVVFSFVSM
jgi:hypothetical protein